MELKYFNSQIHDLGETRGKRRPGSESTGSNVSDLMGETYGCENAETEETILFLGHARSIRGSMLCGEHFIEKG
jgi:hypothetical protein